MLGSIDEDVISSVLHVSSVGWRNWLTADPVL